jgi:hypothetical protein
MYRYLEVRRDTDGLVVLRINITGQTDRQIEKVTSGVERNMNSFEYDTHQRESETELKEGHFDLPNEEEKEL